MKNRLVGTLWVSTALLVICLSLMSPVWAPIPGWTTAAPIPTKREGYGAAEVGGIFYYIAGYIPGDSTINEAYDPSTDTWTTKASLPDTARAETVAVSDGSYVYLIGGRTVSLVGKDLWRYNPATDSWTSLASMPTARATEHMAAYYNGKIYVVGGRTASAPGSGALATVEIYDIASNTWSAGTAMPAARSDAVAIEDCAKIYVFGGCDTGGVVKDTTFIYDIAGDSWSTGASMPQPRANPAGGKCPDGIHVIGGWVGTHALQTSHYVYDPTTDSWSTSIAIPTATAQAQGVSYACQIFVVSGGIGGSVAAGTLNQVFQCVGFGVIPEYPIGTIIGAIAMFATLLSFGVVRKRKWINGNL